MLDAEPQEVPVIRDFLAPHKDALVRKLWAVVETPAKGRESQRLRAAAALANYAPSSDKWVKAGPLVVNDLVLENPVFLGQWSEAYRPVRQALLAPLSAYFKDRGPEKAAERTLATNLLADYAADNPKVLANLLLEADEKQYARLFPLVERRSVDCLAMLTGEIDKKARVSAIQDKMVFETKGTIADDDAKVKLLTGAAMPAKRYEVRLQGGKKYRLTMDSKDVDSFLVLQDKAGKELASDDESGGGLNSLLLFTPSSDDTYAVIAAALQNQKETKNTGSFHLKIVETFTGSGSDEKEELAKRQANAAVALLRMNQPEKVWPLLKHSPDPRLRSYLIHRFGPMGADAGAIIQRLDEEPDITIRRALILSLGEYGEEELPIEARRVLLPKLQSIYRTDPDPGLHGAAEWLLRHWGHASVIKTIDNQLKTKETEIYRSIRSRLPKEVQAYLLVKDAKVAEIQRALKASEEGFPNRQLQWEKQCLQEAKPLYTTPTEGLIEYYPLDEKAGTSTKGEADNSPEGTYQGNGKVEWVPGVMGQGLRLDGKGTMVGSQPIAFENDQPISYGCWFQYEAPVPMVLLSNRDQTRRYSGFDLSLEENHQIRMEIVGDDPKLLGDRTFAYSSHLLSVITKKGFESTSSSGWRHVMVTYDGSKKASGVKIFLDGQLQETMIRRDQLKGSSKSTVPFYLGSRQGTYAFRGELDEVRVYARCLSEKDVSRLYDMSLLNIMRRPQENRSPEQKRVLETKFRRLDKGPLKLQEQLASALHQKVEGLQPQWYVNGQDQTMVVIPGPVEFLMGSPVTEKDRRGDETQHKKKIGRTFAIAAGNRHPKRTHPLT